VPAIKVATSARIPIRGIRRFARDRLAIPAFLEWLPEGIASLKP
jgi:hypothetical protein